MFPRVPAADLPPAPLPSPGRGPLPEDLPRWATVQVPRGGLLTPSRCACCMAPAGRSEPVQGLVRLGEGNENRPNFLVPYCDVCYAHLSAARTRWLACLLASLLLGLTAAVALPLAWGTRLLALQIGGAGLAAAVPWLALTTIRRRPSPGHTAHDAAVWGRPRRRGPPTLVCQNPRWAAEVARMNEVAWESIAPGVRSRPIAPWVAVGACVLAVPLAHAGLSTRVRVLNLSSEPAILIVDDRKVATVPPSSVESPEAGREVRLVAGRRSVQLVSESGAALASSQGALHPASDHLFVAAPAGEAERVCFWLERAAYGRAKLTVPAREPLRGEGPLFRFPDPVDVWFAPLPSSEADDERSSGGTLTAVRQDRCVKNGRGAVRPMH